MSSWDQELVHLEEEELCLGIKWKGLMEYHTMNFCLTQSLLDCMQLTCFYGAVHHVRMKNVLCKRTCGSNSTAGLGEGPL